MTDLGSAPLDRRVGAQRMARVDSTGEARKRAGGDRIATASVMFAGLLRKGLTFLMLPVYTRAMSPGEYGVVAFGTALVVMMQIVATLSLPSAAARFVLDASNIEQRRRLLGTTILSVAAISLVAFGSLFIAGPMIVPDALTEFAAQPRLLLLTIWATLVTQALALVVSRYALARRRHVYTSGAETAQEVTKHSALLALVVAGGLTPMTYFAGFAIGGIATLGVNAWAVREDLRLRWDRAILRQSLAFSLPLVLHSTAYAAIQFIDRLLLAPMVEPARLGQYHVNYSLVLAPFAVIMLLLGAWTPIAAISFQKGSAECYRRMSDAVSEAGVLVGVVVLFAIPWVYRTNLLGAEYEMITGLTSVLIMAEILYLIYSASVTPLGFYKRHQILPLITGVALAVNVVAIFVLVPRYGVLGAGVATLLAFSVMGVGTLVASQKLTGESARPMAVATLLAGGSYVLISPSLPVAASVGLGLLICIPTAVRLRRSIRAFFAASAGLPT